MKTLLNFFFQVPILFTVTFQVVAAELNINETTSRSISPTESSRTVTFPYQPELEMGQSMIRDVSCKDFSRIRVALYDGRGVMEESYDLWQLALSKIDKNADVVRVSADNIKHGDLESKSFSLFIIPGGQTSSYRQDLDECAVEKINEFVKFGGKCIAVGGGAYYLSKKYTFSSPILSFNRGAQNGAGLCRATAHGPFSPAGNQKADICGRKFFPVMLNTHSFDKKMLMAFSYGGCYFPYEEKENIHIITHTQTSGMPVVIGQGGNIVLSGIHPEFNSFIVFREKADQWSALSVDESSIIILREILKYLKLDR